MDNTFLAQITNGTVERVESNRNGSFVLVSYTECPHCDNGNQMMRLNVGENTVILDEAGNRISLTDLRKGMTVNAAFSLASTRSIPPQSSAYVIQVVQSPQRDQVTIGRIVDVDRRGRIECFWQANEFFGSGSGIACQSASCGVYDSEHSTTDDSL